MVDTWTSLEFSSFITWQSSLGDAGEEMVCIWQKVCAWHNSPVAWQPSQCSIAALMKQFCGINGLSGTRVKALAPVLVFTKGTDRLIPLLDPSRTGWEEWSKHGAKINRLLFMKHFVGQQTNFDQYSNVNGNQRRGKSSGTLWVKGCDFVTTQASQFWTHWSLVRSVSSRPCKRELQ